MKKLMTILLAASVAVLSTASVEARVWKNKQGKVVNAHYLTSDEKNIILVLEKDGREVTVAKDQFSDEDRKYVEEQEVLLTVPAYDEMKKGAEKKPSGMSGEWKRSI